MFIDIHTHKKHNIHPAIINAYDGFDRLDKNQFYSIGLHPCKINENLSEIQLNHIRNIMLDKNILAIGECGLDTRCGTDYHKQKSIFIQHIHLANEVKKPLIIHCVKAHEELIHLLIKHECKVLVLIHGFNNKWQVAEKYIEQGYFISLGKYIFNPKTADLIHKIPIEQLFFETDDSEIGIEAIYEKAASLLKIEISDLMIQIQKNGTTLLSNSTLPWKT